MNFYILISGTIIILIFSWFFSVKHKRYHGIVRFFSFESIFILLLLNYRTWFTDPFSPAQIISWVLLILSVYPGIDGYFQLKRKGKSKGSFENTTVIVKSGIYRYIRHPLYCSLLLFGSGVVFKDPGILQIFLGAVNVTAIIFTALVEEREMISGFGDSYRDYMKETKMFIPFVA